MVFWILLKFKIYLNLEHPDSLMVLLSFKPPHSIPSISLPFLPSSPPPPFSFPPFFHCHGSWGGWDRGAAFGLTFFALPASPLSLLPLPPFQYSFTSPTPFISAYTCTPPPLQQQPTLAQAAFEPEVASTPAGAAAATGWWGRRVRQWWWWWQEGCCPMHKSAGQKRKQWVDLA